MAKGYGERRFGEVFVERGPLKRGGGGGGVNIDREGKVDSLRLYV